MRIQPIDVPSLFRAVIWPVLVIVALFIFRRPLGDLVAIVGRGVRKFSFAGASIEVAAVSDVKPRTLDAEIRQLEAGPQPQSGSSGISDLINQLQYGERQDYIVIDLGSKSEPRWLTSRLYLLTFLISLIRQPNCVVFVHTIEELSRRFVGIAPPDAVRWALARTYPLLESAGSAAYARAVGNVPLQFDQATGTIQNSQLVQFMQQFLSLIRWQAPTPVTPPQPMITFVSPLAGPVGTLVTIKGANFGNADQPTKSVSFNGVPAEPSRWNDNEIVAPVPLGARSGLITVVALGRASNTMPFAVGPSDSAEWLLLPSGMLEHAKWLDESRLRRVLGRELNDSYVMLQPNKTLNDLSDPIIKQAGKFVAVVEQDKTFRCLVDRAAFSDALAKEFLKQAASAN